MDMRTVGASVEGLDELDVKWKYFISELISGLIRTCMMAESASTMMNMEVFGKKTVNGFDAIAEHAAQVLKNNNVKVNFPAREKSRLEGRT